MKKEYSFEKLLVWQEARQLVKWIYKLTGGFPESERYGIVDQMRRASVSVLCNIAEGTARDPGRDQARFYQLSYGSLIELLTQLIVSSDLSFINDQQLDAGRRQVEGLTPKVASLRHKSLNRSPKP